MNITPHWIDRVVAVTRRTLEQGPASLRDTDNAKRHAEYVARRNGIKAPLLQIWRA